MSEVDYIDEFLHYLEFTLNRAKSTLDKYSYYLTKLQIFLKQEREKTLLDANLDDLEMFSGLHLHRLGLSLRTRMSIVSVQKSFYAWLYARKKVISDNPAAYLQHPDIGIKLPKVMPNEYAEKYLNAPDTNTLLGIRDAAIFALLLSGLRVSGVCNLNEDDLLWYQDKDGKIKLSLKVQEKGRKERIVPVTTQCQYLVRAYLGHPDLNQYDRNLTDGDKVLIIKTKSPAYAQHQLYGERLRLQPAGVRVLFDKYGRPLRIPREYRHPHSMRHLYATELAEGETPIEEIQALLGHSSPTTTEIYIRTAKRRLAKSVDQNSPLVKMRTPVTPLIETIEKGKNVK